MEPQVINRDETSQVVDAGQVVDGAQSASLRQRKKDATMHSLVESAWALFAERGYDDTSINDIAERANVAPRTFFRYFPTKEAVMYPEFEATLDRVRAAFFQRPADEPVVASLTAALVSLTDTMTEDTQFNNQRMQMIKHSSNVVGDYFRQRLTELAGELVRTRDAGHPDVELRAKLASGIIGLIMDTSREHWLETGAIDDLPDVGNRCMSLVHELLAFPNPNP